MTVRNALLGDRRARTRVVALAVAIPLAASAAFLADVDAVLALPLLALPVALAVYSGWARAGALAGCAAVFLTVLWRYVFPPLIGYLRWSWDTRYTPPRALGYKLDPPGELLEGVTYGPVYAFAVAVALGGAAYLLGRLLRRLVDRPTAAV